jgi:hypothetical protein
MDLCRVCISDAYVNVAMSQRGARLLIDRTAMPRDQWIAEGVERACHTGQHRSLQSGCVTQEIGPNLGPRVLSRYNAASV